MFGRSSGPEERQQPATELLLSDPVVADSRLSAYWFAAATFLLALAALVGLASWPAEDLFQALTAGGPIHIFVEMRNYALLVVVAYWGGRPSPLSRGPVFVAWILLSIGLAYGWRHQLPIGFDANQYPPLSFLLTTMAAPCAVALAFEFVRSRFRRAADEVFAVRHRWMLVLILLFATVPQSALSLSSNLHPYTMDLVALQWDRAAGLNVNAELIAAVNGVMGLGQLVELAYGLTPLGLLAVAVLQLRGRPRHVASSVLLWVGMSIAALTAYHLMPITGPRYVFGADRFAAALASAVAHPLEAIPVGPYPRNGMPSMHFGWMLAASILWWQTGSKRWSRAVMIVATGLTATGTLYLGEHYLVDLIVAVPFVLAVIALVSTGVPWHSAERRLTLALGFATWLAWVMLLRWRIEAIVAHPWTCWAMLTATALVVVKQVRWMKRFAAVAATSPPSAAAAPPSRQSALYRRFGALFFVSGFAALVYQVLFAKQLALTFGSTATATFTVLATFLGGMAIGSLAGGALAYRSARPLVVYAFVEVGIAVYCVATPKLFDAAQWLYVAVAGGLPPEGGALVALRVALGAGVLLLPTALMGATLPLLAQALEPAGGRMGPRVAWLYFTNTAGAAIGALATAYLVIPALGAHRTTLTAAMLNLLVGLAALELAKRADLMPQGPPRASDRPSASADRWSPLQIAALAALGLGGVLSLGLEVVYVHLLSVVAGNSTYAFGLMVATFLFGLSLGGEAARRIMMRPTTDIAWALGLSLLGLAITVSLSAGAWNSIPDYFASYEGYPVAASFWTREAIRGVVCAAVMMPATLCIGAAYAFAMDIVTAAGGPGQTARLGRAAAANTGGNIAGVLLFGFVALPMLGGLGASRLVAAGAAILGLAVLLVASPRRPLRVAASMLPVAGALAIGAFWSLDYTLLSSGANVYFEAQQWGKVLAHAESIDGGLTTVATTDTPAGPVKTLLTNGKFQGNDSRAGEMQAQTGFGLASLLHTAARDDALVIGYGTGVTSRVLAAAGFKSLDIAELSQDVVRLADTHFPAVNAGVSGLPGVQLHVTDGRNFLLLSQRRYDLISIEISSIWFAGAASLYNQEFYRLAKSRLRDDGVLQQWVQMHHLAPTDILQVVTTLRSEFRYVSFYLMGGQGILVATNDARRAAPSEAAAAMLDDSPSLRPILAIVGRPARALVGDLVLDAAGVDRFVTEAGVEPRAWISTDDNLRLEYSTPKANVNDARSSFENNRNLLARFR